MKKIALLVVCGCVLALMAGCAKGPSEAYKDLTTKAEKQDWAGVYDSISAKSQGQVDGAIKMIAGMGSMFAEGDDAKALEKIGELEGRELFAAVMSRGDSSEPPFPLGTVTKEEVSGDKAALTVKTKKGNEESVAMVRENKQWKLVFSMN